MNVPVLVLVVLATAAVVTAGIAFTIRGFASATRAANAERNGTEPVGTTHVAVSKHGPAATEILKRFFDGKDCAMCKRPVPPVQRTGLKPGLWNPVTHETHSWNEIPDDRLTSALDGQLALCPSCQVAESFRQRYPDRVTDRDRSLPDALSRPVV